MENEPLRGDSLEELVEGDFDGSLEDDGLSEDDGASENDESSEEDEPFEEIEPVFDEDATDVLDYKVPRIAPSGLETFEYEALPPGGWIRLLKLHAVHDTADPIAIELQPYELTEAAEYYTLSYAWGRPAEHFPESWDIDSSCRLIMVNGKCLGIRPNLFHALACLRLDHPEDNLYWGDAICINQQDLVEKRTQIKLMATIFTESVSTLAWLGPPDNLTANGVNKIEAIATTWDSRSEHLQDLSLAESDMQSYIEITQSDFANAREIQLWDQMASLFARSWWKRGWILQEAILSSEYLLMIGRRRIDLNTRVSAYRAIVQHIVGKNMEIHSHVPHLNMSRFEILLEQVLQNFQGYINLGNIKASIEERASRDQSPDLLAVLGGLRYLHTSDKKDKVFAGLGLLDETSTIEADYIKTVQAIYVEAASACIKATNQLAIFSHCRFPALVPKLPSWCPDWSDSTCLPRSRRWLFSEATDIAPLWSAGGPLDEVRFVIRDIDKALVVPGTVFSTLSLVVQSNPPDGDRLLDLAGHFSGLHCWAVDCATNSRDYELISRSGWDYNPTLGASVDQFEHVEYSLTQEPLSQAYLRTLCADEMTPAPDEPVRFKDVKERYPRPWDHSRLNPRAFNVKLKTRTFSVSDEGYLVLVPIEAQVNDKIALIRGHPVFVVIREHDSGQPNTFHLIGECYIHGVMDGELYEESKRNDAFEDIIIL